MKSEPRPSRPARLSLQRSDAAEALLNCQSSAVLRYSQAVVAACGLRLSFRPARWHVFRNLFVGATVDQS